MVQIVNRPDIGEQFGTGLGAGLSSGLNILANYKLQELQSRNIASNLEKASGGKITRDEALALSQLPDMYSSAILKQKLNPSVLTQLGSLFGNISNPFSQGQQQQLGGDQTGNQESVPAAALRNIVSGGIKAAGAPGNLISTLLDLLNIPVPSGSPFAKGINEIQSILPTSQNLSSLAQRVLPEGYTQPQGPLGGAVQSGLQTLGELMTPLPGIGGLGLKAAAPLAASSAAGGLVAPSLGLSKEAGELGGLVAPSLVSGIKKLPQAIRAASGQILKDVEQVAKKAPKIPAEELFSKLREIEDKASSVFSKETVKPLTEAIAYAQEGAVKATGQAHLDRLIHAEQRIGDLLSGGVPEQVKPLIEEIKNELIPNLIKKESPEFYPLFERAQRAFETQGGKTFIEKSFPQIAQPTRTALLSPFTYGMLGILGYPLSSSVLARSALTGGGILGTNALLRRLQPFYRNPELLGIVGKMSAASAKNNPTAFTTALNKLDNFMKKNVEKEKA